MSSDRQSPDSPVPVQRALDHLLDAGDLHAWITDLTPRTVWVSPSWLRFAHRDAKRDFITSWGEHVHPDDRDATLERLRTAAAERTPFVSEYRIHNGDGVWRRMLARGIPFDDGEGRVLGLVGVNQDITELRHAEHERVEAERQAHQSQRLESLGLMAGGIAHDFNNLLTGVLGHAELALDALPADSPVCEQIRHVCRAASRAAALSRQMLAFAGQTPVALLELDLGRLVLEMRDLLADAAGASALGLDVDADLPPVRGDRVLLEQVVINLVKNAAESYDGARGPIGVTVARTIIGGSPAVPFVDGHECPAGEYVELSVRDAGSGMSPDVLARVFDPFYTTKFAGRGLGLASVLGTMRMHGGGVRVESRTGMGSTFHVLLPAATTETPGGA